MPRQNHLVNSRLIGGVQTNAVVTSSANLSWRTYFARGCFSDFHMEAGGGGTTSAKVPSPRTVRTARTTATPRAARGRNTA